MSEKQTTQHELARVLQSYCRAWGIEDDYIAAHEMARVALEFVRNRIETTFTLIEVDRNER